ncbi:MAG: flagellar export chaperone FliS [Pirellulales bacterium]
MTCEARRAYVAAELQSASPQRLRWMLIEATISDVRKARETALAGDWAVAGESFVRARRAVVELLTSVDVNSTGDEGELARRVRALYAFLFRQLTEAQLYRDPRRLDDVLKILSLERETWRQVCDQTRASAGGETHSAQPPSLSLHG